MFTIYCDFTPGSIMYQAITGEIGNCESWGVLIFLFLFFAGNFRMCYEKLRHK